MLDALVFALALAVGGVYSGRDNQVHVAVPRLEAPAVTIDGVMEERAWQQAARLTDFSQYSPVDGRPADDPTEVFVFYSPTTIYFGVKAQAASGAVHATLANRDKIDADDAIQIFLNPFNDGRQSLVFAVNPLGIQADGALVEGSGKPRRRPVRRARERTRGHGPDTRLRIRVEGAADRLRLRGRDRDSVQDALLPPPIGCSRGR